MSTTLHTIAVDAWGAIGSEAALARLFATIIIDVFEVEGVDVTGDVSAAIFISIDHRFTVAREERGEEEEEGEGRY